LAVGLAVAMVPNDGDHQWASLRKRLSRLEVTVGADDAPSFEAALADLDAMTPAEAEELLTELDAVAPYVANLGSGGSGFRARAVGAGRVPARGAERA
jgi:hypothetical protein